MASTSQESIDIMKWLGSAFSDGSDATKMVEIKAAMAKQRELSDATLAAGQETIRRAWCAQREWRSERLRLRALLTLSSHLPCTPTLRLLVPQTNARNRVHRQHDGAGAEHRGEAGARGEGCRRARGAERSPERVADTVRCDAERARGGGGGGDCSRRNAR